MNLQRSLLFGLLFVAAGLIVGCDTLSGILGGGASKKELLGILSLVALLVAVVISCISERNVGIMCIAFGFLIAMSTGGVMKVSDLHKFFPLRLFMILVGATLLFSMATINGTVEKMVKWAVKGSRGIVGMLPIIFFVLSVVLAAIGPGTFSLWDEEEGFDTGDLSAWPWRNNYWAPWSVTAGGYGTHCLNTGVRISCRC